MLPSTYILGYGNLGQHLLKLFLSRGIIVEGIFTDQEVELPVRVFPKTEINSVLKPNDLVFVVTKDDTLHASIKGILDADVLKIFCSGGVPLSDISDENVGVWYPLYSFSKDVDVDWSKIPVFIEYHNAKLENVIALLNEKLNIKNRFLNSEHRGRLHVAAVFANNFVNACLIASSEVLTQQQTDAGFQDLLPIIEQTIEKVKVNNALENQTGPAKRGDHKIMQKHLSSLENFPDEKILYECISQYIQQKMKNNL